MKKWIAGMLLTLVTLPVIQVGEDSIRPARFLTATATETPAGPHLTSTPDSTPSPSADAFENNYDFDHARQIVVGGRIEGLNFVCPVSACADNDFYSIVLKGGQCYRFETADLVAGIDTNLIVYGAERDQSAPLGGNDDATPDELRSVLDLCLPDDFGVNTAYILIGNVGNQVPPEPIAHRTYTLAISLISPTPTVQPSAIRSPTVSPEPSIEAQPTITPTPTEVVRATAVPQPTSQAENPNGDNSDQTPLEIPNEVAPAPQSQVPPESGVNTQSDEVPSINDAPKGLAFVIVEQTDLHIAPGARTEVVRSLRNQEQVKLFGHAKGAWVRVQPFTSVVPGWVYAADLLPLPGTISGTPALTETLTLSPTLAMTPSATLTPTVVMNETPTSELRPTPTAMVAVVEAVPDPVEEVSAEPHMQHLPIEITVGVLEAATAPMRQRGPTATPAVVGMSGMRVQIVTVFGDLLVEAVTSSDGLVTFTRDVPPDTALFVQIPALGLRKQIPVDEVETGKASLTVTVPIAAQSQSHYR